MRNIMDEGWNPAFLPPQSLCGGMWAVEEHQNNSQSSLIKSMDLCSTLVLSNVDADLSLLPCGILMVLVSSVDIHIRA